MITPAKRKADEVNEYFKCLKYWNQADCMRYNVALPRRIVLRIVDRSCARASSRDGALRPVEGPHV